jgi:DNA-binding MarR family transcriptional regulator
MRDEQALRRPIGWWLKEADAAIDGAFDAALAGTGVDRRSWQVLSTLGRGPQPAADVVRSLSAFDPPTAVREAIDGLARRGWVDAADPLRLTPAGSEQLAALTPSVEAVRRRVSAALPDDDYVVLVRSLARLVEGLRS